MRPLLGLALALGFVACSSSSATPGGEDASTPSDASAPAPDAAPNPDAQTPTPSDAGTCAPRSAPFAPGTSEATITVGGRQRTFLVHVPPSLDATRPTPVVLVLHGGGGSGKQAEDSTLMSPIADREGFIAVYPDGIGVVKTWNGGLCCGRAMEDKVDDTAFVAALLDHVEGRACVDKKRVFATGMSNGSLMSHRLACELSSRIAAIAPVAGTIGVAECKPTRPVPVFVIHGSADAHVPPPGGVGCGPSGASFTSIPTTMEGWRDRNGCTATTTPAFEQGDGKCVAYTGCKAPTVLCTIDGGGHNWPGGAPKVAVGDCPADGKQSTTFIASEAAWKFFKDNPMP